MGWQATLAGLKECNARIKHTCNDCQADILLNVDRLIAQHGADWTLWDRRDPCPECGSSRTFYRAGHGNTPIRPLRSGPEWDAQRKAFLQSFGFSRRDIVRIKAMAEAATATYTPRPLNDLDVAIRVGASVPPPPPTMTGQPLGEWRGRKLFYWRMEGPELALWKARPKGPRSVD